MSTPFEEMYKHNLWANLRTLDICERLTTEQLEVSVPGVYGSVSATLIHIFGAEERYVHRLTGNQPEKPLRESDGFPGFDVLRERARNSGQALIEIARTGGPTEELTANWPEGKFAIAPQ